MTPACFFKLTEVSGNTTKPRVCAHVYLRNGVWIRVSKISF